MRLVTFASVALALAMLGLPAHAELCVPRTSDALSVPAPTKTVYLAVDLSTCDTCPKGVHVFPYEESNGIEGLQRHDERRDDTCKGQIQPDRKLQLS